MTKKKSENSAEFNATCESARMCEVVLAALADAKGEQVKLLDVRKLTDITDYMVVATGTSERHVYALGERVLSQMREAGWKSLGIEGEEVRDWVLVDFVDVVVHVMLAATRKHYDLEGLWDETLSELLPTQSERAEKIAQNDAMDTVEHSVANG